MRLTPRSRAYLLAFAVAVGLNLLPTGGADVHTLPSPPALAPDSVTRIEIARAARDKVVLERTAEGWEITPLEAAADEEIIERVLAVFADGLALEARLDQGNLEDYRLDFQDAVVVELFAGAEVPALSFSVGADTRGGSSFLRLKDDDAVYRAQVGGRFVYDRDPPAWRDRGVLDEDPAELIELAITRGSGEEQERLRFQALDASLGGGWSLVEDPDFAVDARTLGDLARQLCQLTAGRVLSSAFEGGFDEPAAVAELTFRGGRRVALTVGGRSTERAVFLRRGDASPVYQIAPALRGRLTMDIAGFRDLTLIAFERAALRDLRLEDDGVPVTVARGEDGALAVTDPPNVDLDPRLAQAALSLLMRLRADGVAVLDPEEVGLSRPAMTLTVRLDDGEEQMLEVGKAVRDGQGRALYHVRVVGRDGVFLLAESTLARIRQGFGRAR